MGFIDVESTFIVLEPEGEIPVYLYEDGESQLDWSPDGTQILFYNGDPDHDKGPQVMSADGTGMRRLFDLSASNMDWAPEIIATTLIEQKSWGLLKDEVQRMDLQ